MIKKSPTAFAILASLAMVTPALAELRSPTGAQEIEAIRQTDQTVLIGFHSASCGTCRKQKPALNSLLQRDEFKNIAAFTVDFSAYGPLRKSLSISQPSTLIILKNGKEIARSIGETEVQALEGLLKKGV